LDRSSVPLRLVLPELVMNPRSEPQKSFPYPQIARFSLAGNARAAQSACILGLRQSLVSYSVRDTFKRMGLEVEDAHDKLGAKKAGLILINNPWHHSLRPWTVGTVSSRLKRGSKPTKTNRHLCCQFGPIALRRRAVLMFGQIMSNYYSTN